MRFCDKFYRGSDILERVFGITKASTFLSNYGKELTGSDEVRLHVARLLASIYEMLGDHYAYWAKTRNHTVPKKINTARQFVMQYMDTVCQGDSGAWFATLVQHIQDQNYADIVRIMRAPTIRRRVPVYLQTRNDVLNATQRSEYERIRRVHRVYCRLWSEVFGLLADGLTVQFSDTHLYATLPSPLADELQNSLIEDLRDYQRKARHDDSNKLKTASYFELPVCLLDQYQATLSS